MPSASSFGAILLAAGRGTRFDPLGAQNKLLQPLADGRSVLATGAANLLAAGLRVIAVVRPGDDEVARVLAACGCIVTPCAQAGQGMGASLAHGARQAMLIQPELDGWLVALGDMPAIAPATLASLVQALAGGAQIAVPVYRGRRGNPAGFARDLLPRLATLSGDEGGRAIVASLERVEVAVDDAGVLRDVDTLADLNGLKIGHPEE